MNFMKKGSLPKVSEIFWNENDARISENDSRLPSPTTPVQEERVESWAPIYRVAVKYKRDNVDDEMPGGSQRSGRTPHVIERSRKGT